MNVFKYTKLSKKEQASIDRWQIKQNELIRIEIKLLERKKFFMLKNKYPDDEQSVLSLAAEILACLAIKARIEKENKKNRTGDLSVVETSTKLRAMKLQKERNSDKYDWLLNRKGLIMELREKEAMSLRKICEYLMYYEKFTVSHQLISKFVKEMEN